VTFSRSPIIANSKYKDKKTGESHESAIWWAKYYVSGRMRRESTETADYAEAKDFVKKREGEAASGLPIPKSARRVTFAELAADEVNDYRKNGMRSIVDLEIRLNKHILPRLGHLKATKIRTAEINDYIARRLAEGAANGTINRELTAIRRAFSLGVASEKIHSKPSIQMLTENNVRKGFFDRDQLESVTRHLRPHNGPPALFAFITGWRKGEILSLKWSQVDFPAGIVRLEPGTTKNDEARMFPFTDELREILAGQRAKADALKPRGICPWVFFVEDGGRGLGHRIGDWKRNWRSACEAAGLLGRIFHDFRRTAVRNLVRAGVPERVAMQMTGHKTRAVFERYNIVDEGDLLDAARKLDQLASRGANNDRREDMHLVQG
jgi:integrase